MVRRIAGGTSLKVWPVPSLAGHTFFFFAGFSGAAPGLTSPSMKSPLTQARGSATKPNVLLTGFGPFPGVPVNRSGTLAMALREAAAARFHDHEFHADVLATEWGQAPPRIGALYAQLAPVLALHFGVAKGARAIRLERLARNVRRCAADAAGYEPLDTCLVAGGDETVAVRLPLDAIYQRLSERAFPVVLSEDAGGYLCNAVLYHALSHVSTQQRPPHIGFIHLPDDLERPPLSFSMALEAGLEIIDVALSGLEGTGAAFTRLGPSDC